MYICNCNGINQRQVQAALEAGAARYKEVLAYHGCMPQCGKCQAEIEEALSSRKAVKTVSLERE
ncbi:MAG: ferredoxin [Rhodospirillaceae bacterium]|nr:ferredoxin [Rhodospirillaceae bacterium]|tara:strand:- start:1340 stop:1531 length:192 start_codon:yes stop_codon:yes gene_type:complete